MSAARLPLFGSFAQYQRDRLAAYQNAVQQGPGCYRFGPLRVNLLTDAEYVQAILNNSNTFGISSLIRQAFLPLARNGLLTSEGTFHKDQRKRLLPFFQPRHIAKYAESIVKEAESTIARWEKSTVIDLSEQMLQLTMDVILQILFGQSSFHAEKTAQLIRTVLAYVDVRLSSLFGIAFAWLQPKAWAAQHAKVQIKALLTKEIILRRSSSEFEDLLSFLVQASDEGGQMTDEQILDEIMTLLFAGHETVGYGLAWTWYLLCKHPEIYQRVEREVDGLLHSPTYADLERLPYCLQVFKEALRLYPPVHAIVRVCRQQAVYGGFQFQKGDVILLSPYVLHRDSRFFPDPEKFDPERFLPAQEKRFRAAYLPFGTGPRTCIGKHLALMEGPLLLATLAQRIKFQHAQPQATPIAAATLQMPSLQVSISTRS